MIDHEIKKKEKKKKESQGQGECLFGINLFNFFKKKKT
jgi:hypothetical protein